MKTDKGDIACEHIVSCTGNFARRTGAMVGLDIPVIPVEHQYIVTEPHPAIVERQRKGLPEMGVLREADSSWYMREENGGLLLGPYEKGAPCCYVDGPSPQSEYELFQEDLDRLAPHIETAIARVPAFGEVGIKKVYNGAIAYTPDGSPIIGPAWDLPNFWLNEGHSFGVTAAGGAGWQIAEWIVEGEPSIDMLGVDPRRFGPYATKGYLKVEERGGLRQRLHAPLSGRGARRRRARSRPRPCYDRMQELGAVFGSVYGWERPNWFAPQGYGIDVASLEKPDVLTNENHPRPDAERQGEGDLVLPALELFRARRPGDAATSRRMSAFRTCRLSPRRSSPGKGARQWLDSHPREPHPEDARAHRALPSPARRTAACAPSSPSMNARPTSSTSSRPAPWSATTTTSCASSCRRTAASISRA